MNKLCIILFALTAMVAYSSAAVRPETRLYFTIPLGPPVQPPPPKEDPPKKEEPKEEERPKEEEKTDEEKPDEENPEEEKPEEEKPEEEKPEEEKPEEEKPEEKPEENKEPPATSSPALHFIPLFQAIFYFLSLFFGGSPATGSNPFNTINLGNLFG